MKILSPRVHGYLDYAYVGLFLLAPTLFGFGGLAATICYVLAIAHAGMTLMTAFPLGIVKVIPFTVHAGIEVAMVVLLLAAPFLLGFSNIPAARNFYIAAGALLGVVWLTTDYKAAEPPRTDVAGVRHRAPVS